MMIDFKKLLQGFYEAERLSKDFPNEKVVPSFGFNILNQMGLLYSPVVDEEYLSQKGKRPNWPEGKSFAVCLTHDVDDVSYFSLKQSLRAFRAPFNGLGGTIDKLKRSFRLSTDLIYAFKNGFGKDPLHCYERWLEIENNFDARSTFFFWPGWSNVTQHHHTDCTYELYDPVAFDGQSCSVAEMIQEIHRRGWEIGLHPSWYSFNNSDELKRQKEAVENVMGHTIFSVRQHFLHYDIRKTPRVHSEAGFKYDSTLGFSDNIGFRFGTCYPWKLYDLKSDKQLPILEVPLIIQDVAMLNPFKGLRIDARTAFHYIVQITDVVENVGGVLTLLWHTNEISNPENWALYSKILNYLSGKNPWIASVKQVGDWWLK